LSSEQFESRKQSFYWWETRAKFIFEGKIYVAITVLDKPTAQTHKFSEFKPYKF
jgi:hypothetical protein